MNMCCILPLFCMLLPSFDWWLHFVEPPAFLVLWLGAFSVALSACYFQLFLPMVANCTLDMYLYINFFRRQMWILVNNIEIYPTLLISSLKEAAGSRKLQDQMSRRNIPYQVRLAHWKYKFKDTAVRGGFWLADVLSLMKHIGWSYKGTLLSCPYHTPSPLSPTH